MDVEWCRGTLTFARLLQSTATVTVHRDCYSPPRLLQSTGKWLSTHWSLLYRLLISFDGFWTEKWALSIDVRGCFDWCPMPYCGLHADSIRQSQIYQLIQIKVFSPPARWGLLDFMSVACSSSPLLVSSPPLLSSSCSTATLDAQWSLSDLNHDHPRPVFPAGPQPRPSRPVFPAGPQPRVSPPSVPCRTSTTTIHAQCSLPDLNHDHPRPVFPAGPQPRPSTPSVPCRTSTASIHAKCSLPDLM